MKTRTQKLISLVLVLMMLVSMVPMGIFTASAATTHSIGSAADWNALADAGTIASGDTVNLTADIDFSTVGGEAKTLVQATTETALTFNGGGFAIKNATATAPLIAANLTKAKVSDVTFEKITVTAEGDVALVTAKLSGNSADHTFTNIKVVDCDITSTTGKAAAIAAAQEYGTAGSNDKSIFTATNVTVDADTTITAKTYAAGVLAHASGITNSAQNFTNVYVAATITSTYAFTAGTAAKDEVAVGGIAGFIKAGPGGAREVTLSFNTCAMVGSLKLTNATEANHGAIGGLFGKIKGNMTNPNAVDKLTVSKVLIDLKAFDNVATQTATLGTVDTLATYGFLLILDTAYIDNAPTTDIYDVAGKMYLGTSDAGNLAETLNAREVDDLGEAEAVFANGFLTGFEASINPATCPHEEYWGEFTTIVEANRLEPGSKTRTCSRCLTVETQVIPKEEGEPTIADYLACYDMAKYPTFTINSKEDWNAIATSGKNFNGKTIVLGTNIDFGGATAPTLVPAGLGASTVNFNGNGYSIQNVGSEETPQTAPLIAGSLTGVKGTNPTAANSLAFSSEITGANYIKNVIFENIKMKAEGDVALVALTVTGDSCDRVFENITVKKCELTSTAGDASALFITHERGTGGSWNRSILSISKVTLDADTTITAYDCVAGLVNNAIAGNTNTVYSFANIYMAATLKSTYVYDAEHSGTDKGMVGGILGSSAANNGSNGRLTLYIFDHCVVVGSLLSENGNGWNGRLCGMFAEIATEAAADGQKTRGNIISVTNSIVDLKEYTYGVNYTLSLGFVAGKDGVLVSYDNLYVGNALTNDIIGNSSFYFFNTENPAKGGQQINLPNVATIDVEADAAKADNLKILVMENGFVKEVKAVVRGAGYQKGNVTADTLAIRFLGLAQITDAADVNMKIVATYAGGTKTFDSTSDEYVNAGNALGIKLYDALTEYGDYGATEVTAESLGAQKIAGFTIYDIPANTAITFTVTLSWVNAYGQTIESAPLTIEVDAEGNITPAPAN